VGLRKAFKQKLIQGYFVRWHMSLILAATVASGVLLDKGLLLAGFENMGWRYASSVLGAYLIFFGLVRMWIWYAAGVAPKAPDVNLENFDGALDWVPEPSKVTGFQRFHGGSSGGGGASGLFDAPSLPSVSMPDLDIDLDEGFWIVLVLAVLVVVLCCAGGYLIYMAPEILPEVALEAAIGAGLLRHVKDEGSGWALRLLRSTWIPLGLVLAVAFFAGRFLQSACPGVATARGALYCATSGEQR
jgi:hypothetical protein